MSAADLVHAIGGERGASTARRCFHCNEPLPAPTAPSVVIDGVARAMCCPGCEAVARAIVAGGLEGYYRGRTGYPTRPEDLVPAAIASWRVYDHPALAATLTREHAGIAQTSLMLEGIECAACAWLIERQLAAVPGVRDAELNFSTHRAVVSFDPRRAGLGDLVAAVHRIGYRAHPYDPARGESMLAARMRGHQRRLALAGLLGMQVMMASVALYAGAYQDMGEDMRGFLRWVSLILATPILTYCARSFFVGAWRDLRNRAPGMDVPVSLGLAIAYAGSIDAVLRDGQHVYFDSIAMFVFALLLARYLELAARRRNGLTAGVLAHREVAVARRAGTEGNDGEALVPAMQLVPGDIVAVRPGERIPADGRVVEGISSVAEAILTGEGAPATRGPGDAVLAGAHNLDHPLRIEVEHVGPDTVRSRLLELAERAGAQRPSAARIADRVASRFVSVVLIAAAAVAAGWLIVDPSRCLEVSLAMLVVTCPCALSLATPTALAAGAERLARAGVLITRADALERLARVTHAVLDKTGTLTDGRGAAVRVACAPGVQARDCLALATALERDSNHPVARALRRAAGPIDAPAPRPEELVHTAGAGVQALVDGRVHRLGSPAFAFAAAEVDWGEHGLPEPIASDDTVVALTRAGRGLCVFHIEEATRPDAGALVAGLAERGIIASILSGDRPAAVTALAARVGVAHAHGDCDPNAKREHVRAMQDDGARVVMVGDGINDAPVQGTADVSVAMGDAADLVAAGADVLLLEGRLTDLLVGIDIARRTLAIVRQNLTWAVAYNALVLPAAAAGLVAPWMAAVGMSVSSLVVVGNALRIAR